MGERPTDRMSYDQSPASPNQPNSPSHSNAGLQQSPSQESFTTTALPTELVGRYSTQPSASASVTIMTSANNSTLMGSPSAKKPKKRAGRKHSSIPSKTSTNSQFVDQTSYHLSTVDEKGKSLIQSKNLAGGNRGFRGAQDTSAVRRSIAELRVIKLQKRNAVEVDRRLGANRPKVFNMDAIDERINALLTRNKEPIDE